MRVKLPNGFMDGSDYFNIVDIDELRGKQQNYLADQELVVGNIGHIPKILQDMILSIKTEEGVEWKGSKEELPYKLPAGDIELLLIKIRENTFGPRYYFESDCPHCSHHEKNLKLDLDTLEVTYLPLKELVKKKTIKLPKSEIEVEVKPLYLKDLFNSLKYSKENQHNLFTSFLSLAIKRLGDKTEISPEDLEDLPVKDLQYLGEQAKKLKLEGIIDTDIEIECSSCKKEYTSKLNCLGADFFDPSKGSMS